MSDATRVVETHVSTIFLIGDRAYKLKKPVELGFLDFRTREARADACHSEVQLNRRLAPDVYLGVAGVTDTAGDICDHLVVMRRMPEARRLSSMISGGRDVRGHVRAIAKTMAAFHERADRGAEIDADGTAAAVHALWASGHEQLRRFGHDVLDEAKLTQALAWAGRYVTGRGALFAKRIDEGHIVDGHGDLLAGDIYCLDDGPRILDCLEFDAALRHGDVLNDIASLAMDLERLGHPELGEWFLDCYREFSGIRYPDSLVHHYIAYRAFVRCKVACVRHQQGDAAAAAEARHLLDMTVAHLERSRVALVLVGGAPATGKSTLANSVAAAFGWVVLSSDDLRRDLRGGDTGNGPEMYEAGAFSLEATDCTYTELLHRAEQLLRLGESVILDATWRDATRRLDAHVAAVRAGAELVELRCDVPRIVAHERLAVRNREGPRAGRLSPAIADRIRESFDQWPSATLIDTSGPLSAGTVAARTLVAYGRELWPWPVHRGQGHALHPPKVRHRAQRSQS